MKILEVNDLSGCSKRLSIELEPEDVEREESGVLSELRENAVLPGFRRGRAPISLLRKRFRKSIDEGALGEARKAALEEAVKELGLDIVGEPVLREDDKKAAEAGGTDAGEGAEKTPEAPAEQDEMTFSVDVEFIPKFELANYRDLTVEEPDVQVTETDIANALEDLRNRNALFKSIDTRPARKGDLVTVDVEGEMDGEPFQEGTHENYGLEIGSGHHLPGFEEAIDGKSLDEEFETECVFPEDYAVERHRGKKVQFKLKLKEIRERVLPDLDDEFAKDLGMDSIAELKDMIRERFERDLDRRKDEARRASLVRQLVENHKFDPPPSMVHGRYHYLNAMQEYELSRIGASLDALGDRKESVLRDNLVSADRQTRASIVLQKIAEAEGIEVSDNEFIEELSRAAAESGRDPRTMVQDMVKNGVDRLYRREMLEKKVIDYLLEGAPVEKVPVAEKAEAEDAGDDAGEE